MRPGDLIKDRFKIGALAGVGGMGEVFRARDLKTGEPCAVKVLLDREGAQDQRFEREAMALAQLHHPALVRYVDHGVTEQGQQFLVMEWLEGENLAHRLLRGSLGVEESLRLCREAAGALSVVHEQGIVHRDLKPSNIFLIDDDRIKIFDFGIARFRGAATTLGGGGVLGTIGYMSPEQARSTTDVDARSDVFALGCVFFECLTGRAPFAGQHVMAVLAKILFEQAPRVRDLHPGIPAAIDQLVGRMLAKNADDRPRDGAAVAAALDDLDAFASTAGLERLSVEPQLALGGNERRLFSVVLLGRPRTPASDPTVTLSTTGSTPADDDLRRRAEARGGRFEVLADGTAMVTIMGTTRIATDQAVQAARCALALKARSPDRTIVLTTGQGEVARRLPVGEVIDRAVRMIVRGHDGPPPSGVHSEEVPPSGVAAAPLPRSGVAASGALTDGWIWIDDVTARLLDNRFEVTTGPEGIALGAEHEPLEGVRTLLGKPTSCVGRDRELGVLTSRFDACIEGPAAEAALLVAPAGFGKSRLSTELVRMLRARCPALEVWTGHGDALRAGSAFALIGQALRSAVNVADGEPLLVRREKLVARVARHVAAPDQARVASFLGELMGIPFPDDDNPMLRAARQDAMNMNEHTERAFQDFLHAESDAHPVLLVLESLHWGDLPTVRFVDGALRDLKGQPFMVLALARPEVHEIFPKLWAERSSMEIRLKELSSRSSAHLVREALGAEVGEETVRRIVDLADGNAFYLEELIRAVAEGQGTVLPPTVLAMVTARLEGLDTEARRALRAASVFGETFWSGGATALLGGESRSTNVESWFTALAEREVLVRRIGSRFPGEREYRFRHALLREGAYAMLTEADRTLGHRLAGTWLEQSGETDPMVLAEHFERGGDRARAARHFLRAAEQAHWGNDADAAIARAQRGLGDETPDDVRAALLGLLCEAYVWKGDPGAAAEHGEKVLRLAKPGAAPWARVAVLKIGYSLLRGQFDDLVATLSLVRGVDPDPDAVDATALALCLGIFILDLGGNFPMAELFRRRLREVVEPVAAHNPVARGWMLLADTQRILWAEEEPWRSLDVARMSRDAFREAGHRRGALEAQVFVGMNLWRLGMHAEAERELHEAEAAEQGLGITGSLRSVCLIGALLDRGAVAEARALGEALVARCHVLGFAANEGRARWTLADVLCTAGDLAGADREYALALDLLATVPLDRAAAMAMRGRVRLEQGRAAEALTDVTLGLDFLTERGAPAFRGEYARLVQAEAMHATGDADGALRAIVSARDRVLAQAAKIDDPTVRASFLENVPEHRRTLELAAAWLS
jgi:tetratricopeptide (TPR) repeat protein